MAGFLFCFLAKCAKLCYVVQFRPHRCPVSSRRWLVFMAAFLRERSVGRRFLLFCFFFAHTLVCQSGALCVNADLQVSERRRGLKNRMFQNLLLGFLFFSQACQRQDPSWEKKKWSAGRRCPAASKEAWIQYMCAQKHSQHIDFLCLWTRDPTLSVYMISDKQCS